MATEPLPSVNAEKIRWPTFSVVRRGFDQQEVLDYSAQVADMVQDMETELERLRSERAHGIRRPLAETPPSDSPGGVWLPPAAPAVDREAIRRPKFSVVRRGFDKREVQAYTNEVAEIAGSLSAEIQQLRLEPAAPDQAEADRATAPDETPLAIAEDETAERSADAGEPVEALFYAEEAEAEAGDADAAPHEATEVFARDEDPYRTLSTHVAEVLKAMDRDVEERLHAAEAEAERIRREAEMESERRLGEADAEARRRLSEAGAEAARRLAEADEEAQKRRREADIEAEISVRQASAAARDVVSEAKTQAEQLIGEARAAAEEAKIAAARALEQADAMSAAVADRRDSVVRELGALRERVQGMIDELGREASGAEQERLIRLDDVEPSGNGSGREDAEDEPGLRPLPQMPGQA